MSEAGAPRPTAPRPAPAPLGRAGPLAWPLVRLAKREARRLRERPGALGPMGVEPRPLVLPRERLVVLWSPKSACTQVLLWVLNREGLLDAALAHHPWPHRYRMEALPRSAPHREAALAVAASGGAGHTLLRVTREPDRRLVSIFRHLLRHPRLLGDLSMKLGRDLGREGLSLADLDRFLVGEDLAASRARSVNLHLCAQAHPVEALGFDRVITLNVDTDPLEAGLAAVERDLGLAPTRLGEIARAATIRERHHARPVAYRGAEPIETHRFRPTDTRRFPTAALLASPLLQSMARRHHAADRGRVATADTAGRLFAPAA